MRQVKEEDSRLRGFFTHGVPMSNTISGDEYISECPFCEKTNHFYIHIKKLVWKCHRCGEGGNYLKFLEKTSELNQKFIKPNHLEALADDRGLPVEAFEGYGIGFDGSKFTYPIYGPEGNFIGLRYQKIGQQMKSTFGTEAGIFNVHNITLKEDLIWLCEGEADCIAMNWLLKTVHKKGIAVGIPGANIFLDQWVPYFYNKDVRVLYDYDDAGQQGAVRVHGKLENTASTLLYIHWPDDLPQGYDVRDLIKELAIEKEKPKTCYKTIRNALHEVPQRLINQAQKDETGKYVFKNEVRREKLEPIKFKEIVALFQKHFEIPNDTAIRILFGSIFANKLEADMVWMFMVGAPSSLKSELIQSLKLCPEVEMLTTMTPNTLVSGYKSKEDVSLLNLLNNRFLAIKDFTTTLNMMQAARDAIFGQLRDIYDGQTDRFYGHGDHKRIRVKFGIIAGVTPAIEKLAMLQQTLGERFLRYNLPILKKEESILSGCEMVLNSIGKEATNREEIALAVKRFIGTHSFQRPTLPEKVKNAIISLGRYTARLRGYVERDYWGNILYKPGSEGPFRLVKQLAQLGMGLAVLENKAEVGMEEVRILQEVVRSTCPGRVEAVVKTLFYSNGTPLPLKAVSEKAHFPPSTVKMVLEDLVQLRVVHKKSVSVGSAYYQLQDSIKELIRSGNLYN